MVTTVLIVDDHPTFRATARLILEAEGYDVIGEAPDGHTAISEAGRLRQNNPSGKNSLFPKGKSP